MHQLDLQKSNAKRQSDFTVFCLFSNRDNRLKKMKEVLMTDKQIADEIEFEDECGMNTLLQNLLCFKDEKKEINIFMKVNEKGENAGYVIRDKNTGEDCQL